MKKVLRITVGAIEDAMRGGTIVQSFLNHMDPNRSKPEMLEIEKAIPLALNVVSFKRQDLYSIDISQAIDPNLPKTWASIAVIQRIFVVIIENAYDAIKRRQITETPRKGRIEIKVTHRAIENAIRIMIADDGDGMDEKLVRAANLGTPYFTTKGSTLEKSEEGGIHNLAQAAHYLGGRFEYRSQKDEGTSCIVDLPVSQKPSTEGDSKTHDKNSHR